MKVGIVKDTSFNGDWWRKYQDYCESKGYDSEIFEVFSQNWVEDAEKFDIIVWRTAHLTEDQEHSKPKIYFLDKIMNKIVFPDWSLFWHYDDKIRQNYIFKKFRFNTPQTWVFYKKEDAIKFVEEYKDYPLVHKIRRGASSSMVTMMKDKEEAISKINKLFDEGVPDYFKWNLERGYAYFQEFIPNNDFDIRITTVGNRAFGFVRFNRDDDFRASGSGKVDYDEKLIPPECKKIALEISKKLDFETMAYDFILDKNGKYTLIEISYTFDDRLVHNCPGYHVFDESGKATFVEGNYWVQHLQLKDLVEKFKSKK